MTTCCVIPGITNVDLLPKYADTIRALPPSELTDAHLLKFLLQDQPPLRIYFAPFEWINEAARIVIVGITPGRASMQRALLAARSALHEGLPLEEVSKRAKQTGSFSNMRKTLSNWLDAVGVQQALRISSSAELFGARADLLHPTSAVRYPVFKGNENYGGYSPSLTRHPALRYCIENMLAAELQRLPRALLVPLGPAVEAALLVAGADERRCLTGFPHASNGPGANERAAKFKRETGQLREKVKAWANASIGV